MDHERQETHVTGKAADSDRQAKVEESTIQYNPVAPQLSGGRYQSERFHARGGMGEIWLAQDSQIGRLVALKRMRKKQLENQERFLAEAQITGQLEHPGVIPVHDLWVDDQGCATYVMKFVEGGTLKDAIDEFYAGGTNDSEPMVAWRRMLDCFVDLCETVAFAHSRGVVHRDIKPDNVMLGPFGETIVLDWGLAKVAGEPEIPGLSSCVTLTKSGRSTETRAGSVLGTPSYMPSA